MGFQKHTSHVTVSVNRIQKTYTQHNKKFYILFFYKSFEALDRNFRRHTHKKKQQHFVPLMKKNTGVNL